MIHNSRLILENGTEFTGKSFGASKSTSGEVVFSTGMVGYDLSLTDPSYSGQILTFTYPLIGNWGVPPKDFWESGNIQVSGLVISDLTTAPSHWQSEKSLDTWLKEQNIPGIYDIDTRALTQKLREKGVMLGKIINENNDIDFWDPNSENLVANVSPTEVTIHHPNSKSPFSKEKYSYLNPRQYTKAYFQQVEKQNFDDRNSKGFEHWSLENSDLFRISDLEIRNSPHIALLNCGAKKNILRHLLARGSTVYELPWNYDPFEDPSYTPGVKLGSNPENTPGVKLRIPRIDGLVISNGPGDPKMAKETIEIIKKSLNKKVPTFGICLGNQLLALAAGGDTYKLKFGHRAQNQPTIMANSNRCYITTQNHGFAVNEKKLPKDFKRWFYNANDNSNEGLIHQKLPFFSVQFHPENNPGPKDTEWLFDYFFERILNQ